MSTLGAAAEAYMPGEGRERVTKHANDFPSWFLFFVLVFKEGKQQPLPFQESLPVLCDNSLFALSKFLALCGKFLIF